MKRKTKHSAIRDLLWAGNPFSIPCLRFLDWHVPVVRVKRIKGLL